MVKKPTRGDSGQNAVKCMEHKDKRTFVGAPLFTKIGKGEQVTVSNAPN